MNTKLMNTKLLFAVSAALGFGALAAAAAHAQTNYQRLKSFGFPDLVGTYPVGVPIEGSDGALYGTTAAGGPDGVGTVYKLKKNGTASILHLFRLSDGGGWGPSAGLVEGNDGALYGTTLFGGNTNIDNPYGFGTVYKLNKDGGGYAVLHRFSLIVGDGFGPEAALMEGTDGTLFGTTAEGGAGNGGTVFKLNKDGSGYAVLRSFSGEDGRNPRAGLIEGSDGALYGSTHIGGGTNGVGTLFKLNRDGSGYALLHKFTGTADGWGPAAALVQGSNGALYGTTFYGGNNDAGTAFKLNSDGSSYGVLHSFSPTGPDGHNPEAALVQGSDGAFYGTTFAGGDGAPGTVFKLNADGSGFTVIHRFVPDAWGPTFGLTLSSDKALYGSTAFGGSTGSGMVFKLNNDGSGYSIVQSFGRSGGDGTGPQAALVEGSNGAFYGTTSRGGTNDAGTVFKLNKDGSGYTVLHYFGGEDAHPLAGLVQGSDGKLYGTTFGAYGYTGGSNVGTVFKLNQDGSGYTLLHNFNTNGVDGLEPLAALIQGTDGALYGTTSHGGTTNANDPSGFGTVFKLNQDGTGYTVLHAFGSSDTDGQNPKAGLIEASDGDLYGTTTHGGSNYAGTVFKLNKDGSAYSVLRHLDIDGYWPSAGVLEGLDGILYGTTDMGGTNDSGTVFKLNKDGSGYTRLLSFDGAPDYHGNPVAGLVEGMDGALYGTTDYGGAYTNGRYWQGYGTVFKLNKDGSGYTKLRSFTGEDGRFPRAGLMRGIDAALYGTTSSGGDLGFGTVFKLFSSTPVISFERIESSGAGARLSLSGGAAGQTFQIQATANLTPPLWQTIATNQFGIDGKFQFLDTNASNYPMRFYRSATP